MKIKALNLNQNNRKESDRKYYNKNKGEILEYTKQYRSKNKDRIKNYQEKYREKHYDYFKKYYKNNKEQILQQQKQYNRSHPEKLYNSKKKYLEKYGITYNLILWKWSLEIRNRDNYKCQICGKKAEHAHHLLYKQYYPELSLSLNNGISLCVKHHYETHGKLI